MEGLTLRNSPAGGLTVLGSESVGNTLERLTIHDNKNSGLNIFGGATGMLVLNCDSYRNFDPQNNGQDADGFAAKFGIGPGTIFLGCRAWANSDDGWDFWMAGNAVTVEDCRAYDNGFDIWNFGPAFEGNGNGFKLGRGDGAHELRNCLAWGNRVRGFDANANTSGTILYNCTGWDNNFNFRFFGEPKHVLRNCLSHEGIAEIRDATDDESNSWTLPVTVTDKDFRSLSDVIATGPRAADGSLPTSNFLQLANGSDAINAGVDVGLPFSGIAPDLGAYETEQAARGGIGRTEAEAMNLSNYETATRQATSGRQIIQAISRNQGASASYQFTGSDGEYDLRIRYLDETDGRTTFTLIANDVTTRQWVADQVIEGIDLWKTETVEGVFLLENSRIEVQAGPDGGEYARLDYIEVVVPSVNNATLTVRARGTTGEEVMTLRINNQEVTRWKVTSDWADYTYESAVTGNVKVAFVNDKFIRDKIDRNLVVDNIRTADKVQEAEAQAINTGAWAGTCGGGSFSETMQCNGYIDFGDVVSNSRTIASQANRKRTEEDIPHSSKDKIVVYPNPVFNGHATVSIQQSLVPRLLVLVNGTGEVVRSQATDGQHLINLDLSSLPSGVYFLKIPGKESAAAQKIIIW